jgi:hypothetical protein
MLAPTFYVSAIIFLSKQSKSRTLTKVEFTQTQCLPPFEYKLVISQTAPEWHRNLGERTPRYYILNIAKM